MARSGMEHRRSSNHAANGAHARYVLRTLRRPERKGKSDEDVREADPSRRERRRLSKSRFCCGLQCVRQLWWLVHEPSAPELYVPPSLQVVFDDGHQRSHFLVAQRTALSSPEAVVL
jgi:hypothetical protein